LNLKKCVKTENTWLKIWRTGLKPALDNLAQKKYKTQKQFGIISRTTRFSQKGRTYQHWFKLQIAGWTHLAKWVSFEKCRYMFFPFFQGLKVTLVLDQDQPKIGQTLKASQNLSSTMLSCPIWMLQLKLQTRMLQNKYPQFIMGVLAQAKNGDKQFWK
jgi:hypothetical protein